MKLLGQPNSINVRKVLWTCAELGIELECEDWGGAARSTHAPEFLALNPKAMVPVLIDGDFVLTESNAICRYLASLKPESELLPQALKPRAQVEAWMDWQATDLNTAWRAAFMGRVRQHPDFADESAQAASLKTWNAAMSLLNDHLAPDKAGATGYVSGGAFSLADIVLALSTNRWELTPMSAEERPDLPHVAAWMQRLSDRTGLASYQTGFVTHCRNGTP